MKVEIDVTPTPIGRTIRFMDKRPISEVYTCAEPVYLANTEFVGGLGQKNTVIKGDLVSPSVAQAQELKIYVVGKDPEFDPEFGYYDACCIVLASSEAEAFRLLNLNIGEEPIKQVNAGKPMVLAILPEAYSDE